MIALDRVLANVDKSQIIPEERRRREGRSADDLLTAQTPAVLVNLDGDPIWSPITDNDLKFAVNTNWDLFQHAPTKTYYLRNDASVAEGDRRQGTVDAGGDAARQLHEAAGRRQLEGRQGSAARQDASAGGAAGVRQHHARRTDPAAGRAELRRRSPGRDAAVGEQHRERRVPDGHRPAPVYYLVAGRWFSAPDFTGPWTFATPNAARRLQEDPARARAVARARVGAAARRRPPRPCCSRRSRRPRASTRSSCKAPEVAYQGDAAVPADREDHRVSARSTPTRTSSRSATSTTCASRACGSWSTAPTGPWEVDRLGARGRSTRFPRARRRTTSPTSPWSKTTTTSGSRSRRPRRYTGVMIAWGCAVWGTGYYYPPYVWYGGCYPIYHPYYPTYGYQRLVQPVDRRLRRAAPRPTVRTAAPASARATTRGPAPTRAAPRPTVRTARAARRGLQPADRRLARDAAGLERLRQLGHDGGAARRSVGAAPSRVTNNAQRARRRARRRAAAAAAAVTRNAGRAARRRRADRQRRRRTPAGTATSTETAAAAGRSMTTDRGTR